MKNKNDFNIEKMLDTDVTFKASDQLKERILQAASEESAPVGRKQCQWWKIAAYAAAASVALVIVFFLTYNVKNTYASPNSCFEKAQQYFCDASAIAFDLAVRTTKTENFSYINVRKKFVPHTLIIQPSTGCWRLEKEGRVAIFDGQNTWLGKSGTGIKMEGDRQGVIEDFDIFLDPFMMMSLEKQYVLLNKKAVVSTKEKNGAVTIYVKAPANGDFTNNYLKNTSIEETNTRREYVFEKATGRLLSMKIDARVNGIVRTIVKLSNINYDYKVTERTFKCPEDIAWSEFKDTFDEKDPRYSKVGEFIGISPEMALQKTFKALHDWDTARLNIVMMQYAPHMKSIKEYYEGSELVWHKAHFKSGRYPGVFIKCGIKVKGKNGKMETVRRTIALRNDNTQAVWMIDGGI